MVQQEIEKTNAILKDGQKEFESFTDEIEGLSNGLKENKSSLKEKEREQRQFFSDYQSMFNQRKKFEELMQKRELSLIQKEERIRSVEHRFNDKKVNRA